MEGKAGRRTTNAARSGRRKKRDNLTSTNTRASECLEQTSGLWCGGGGGGGGGGVWCIAGRKGRVVVGRDGEVRFGSQGQSCRAGQRKIKKKMSTKNMLLSAAEL
ncbi:hypothetical protein GQ43DRAFT_277784 [Delitschia confertaspora ATCC 74209]|uniref:Uncharacterized protein n=1 Tax=Delitschia confertaspora ATCC 74209 TaxID=1513339 RepID=A0A9P4MUN6_9PLEO|nr:hypothetical protein GQ43DRAFT_277784 [Delitschia confertaspora ATCC 74209]